MTCLGGYVVPCVNGHIYIDIWLKHERMNEHLPLCKKLI